MDEINVVRAQSQPWNMGISLFMGNPELGFVVKDILIEKVENDGLLAPQASVSISNQAAQVLMDDLWNSGLRPTEGTGSAGSLRATEKHLDDMRKIVSKSIGVEL